MPMNSHGFRTRHRRNALGSTALVLSFLFAGALGSPSRADSIVYDFEDGTTQGWTFVDAALHPTHGVFSEGSAMAVFGTDGSSIFLTLDLTDVTSMTWELFAPWLGPDYAATLTTFVVLRPGSTPPFELFLPVPLALSNPGEMSIDLSAVTGVHLIGLGWAERFTLPGEEFPAPTLFSTAFINTITFHLVPEPTGLATMAILVLCLIQARRKQDGPRSHGDLDCTSGCRSHRYG